MTTIKQTRINNLEQSHVIVNNKLTNSPQTLVQVTSSLGLNPGKDADLHYVEARLSILCDEGLCKRTPGDRIADPKFPNRPLATYIML
jgi:hypothetical protein